MELVERYLAAIERGLPRAQAADIKAELRDVLLSRIEEQEARFGHPLTREELEALVVEFGHPLAVAGRYRKIQHLIGPEVFPFWWAGLKTTLAIVAGVYLVLTIVAVVALGRDGVLFRVWPSLGSAILISFAIVTLVGVVVELYVPARVLQQWRPGQLPPAGRKMRPRFEIAAEIAMGIVFILWWNGVLHFRNMVPIPPFLRVELAPVWTTYHWPILAYAVFEIGVNLYAMARPGQSRVNSGLAILRYGLGAVILLKVLEAGHWVTISGASLRPEVVQAIERNFDLGLRFGVIGTAIYMAFRVAVELLRLGRDFGVNPKGW